MTERQGAHGSCINGTIVAQCCQNVPRVVPRLTVASYEHLATIGGASGVHVTSYIDSRNHVSCRRTVQEAHNLRNLRKSLFFLSTACLLCREKVRKHLHGNVYFGASIVTFRKSCCREGASLFTVSMSQSHSPKCDHYNRSPRMFVASERK